MTFIVILFVLLIIVMIIAAPFVFRELRNAVNYSPEVITLGRFSFTDDEWDYVYQKEFVEDEKGKESFDEYSGAVSYGTNTLEDARREIIFTSQNIYLTDGEKGKTFTVNKLNYFKNGYKLCSVDLLHLSPLKRLRIKVNVNSVNPDSGDIDYDLEYLVPIPHSSLEKIDEILKAYGEIILKD